MMGMMTMVRVLRDKEYEAIVMKKKMARVLAEGQRKRKS
jgi:hypothetical protein